MNFLIKRLHKKLIGAMVLAGALLFSGSCDVIKSDVKKDINRGKVDAYKIQGDNFAIDLDAVFPNSEYKGITRDISGILSVTESNGRKFLVYQPKNGIDEEFDIELESNSGETQVASVQFADRTLTACGNAENFTEATISNDSKLVVDLLENEDFCGLEDLHSGAIGNPYPDSLSFNYHMSLGAMSGGVDSGEKQDWLTFTYIPPEDFTGVVEMEYWAAVNLDSEAADTMSTAELLTHPEVSEYYSHHTVQITVTD